MRMRKYARGLCVSFSLFLTGGLALPSRILAEESSAKIPPAWIPPSDAELKIGQRLFEVSERFIGAPYLNNALGEGAGSYDPDPLERLDAFDCTTLVETVWAISRSSLQGPAWKDELQKIRYRAGKVGFFDRLHFIARDWVPYHSEKKSIEDATDNLGIVPVKALTHIDRRSWLQKYHPSQLSGYPLAFAQDRAQDVPLAYLTYKSLLEDPLAWTRLEHELAKGGLMVNFVKPESSLKPKYVQVTHQGFFFIKAGRMILRHASTIHRRVMDVDLLAYIKAQENPARLRGVQLFRFASEKAK